MSPPLLDAIDGSKPMLGRLLIFAHQVITVSQAANPVSPPSFIKPILVTTLFSDTEAYFSIWYLLSLGVVLAEKPVYRNELRTL